MSEIIEKAISKIESEAEQCSGQNVPAIAIYKYLQSKCKETEDFASKVLIETKKLSKCFTYIMEIAFERAKEQNPKGGEMCIGMSSDEIFSIVEDYFNLDDAEIERKKEEEKQAAEERRKISEAEQASKISKEKKKDAPKKEKADQSSQISLF